MDKKKLKEFVALGESNSMEFKKTTGQLERGMETLCAFLNCNGGTVIFGVDDNGKILGQEVSDTTKRTIAESLKQFEPTPTVDVEYIPLTKTSKKSVVLITAQNCENKPFCYRGRPYTRIESTTSIMTQVVYNKLLSQRNWSSKRWEQKTNQSMTIADLDEEEIRRTIRVGVEKGRLPESTMTSPLADSLTRMELMSDGKITNAAVVLYIKNSTMDYAQCQLRLARFRGTTMDEFIDNRQVEGNAFKLLDEAMTFFFKHLSLSGVVKGMIREEELTIPYKALREAVVNALCHREYQTVGAAVTIAIFDDRIEIKNLGSLPMQFDLNSTLNAPMSVPHNPLIAKSFYYRELFESWGRGIKLMVDECRQHNVPLPEFKSANNVVTVTFWMPNVASSDQNVASSDQNVASSDQNERKNSESSSQNSESSNQNSESSNQNSESSNQNSESSNQNSESSNQNSESSKSAKEHLSKAELQNKVRDFCIDWRTIDEIAAHIDKSDTYVRNVVAKSMIDDGILELQFPNSKTHPKQKYRRKQ